MSIMRETKPWIYFGCSNWTELFNEMENCLQNGIEITQSNYLDHIDEFERVHQSWVQSHRDDQ